MTAMIVWMQKGAANYLDLAPAWSWEKLNFWSQLAFAFVGLELGAVMGGEIRDPERTVPRAAWISGLAIAAIYILGTLALLILLPSGEINIVTGLAQAAVASGHQAELPWLSPLIAALIMAAVAGQLGAWIAGSSRIPFVIGVDRYLPVAFGRLHPRWRTPHVAILTQGAACTVFVLAMQAGDDLRTAYQLLVDMTVITTFVPFLYIFLASYRNGQRLSGAAGMLVTASGIAFSLVPPSGTPSAWLFAGKLLAGCALLIVAGRIIFVRGCQAKPARE
jgi:amino acid transporter